MWILEQKFDIRSSNIVLNSNLSNVYVDHHHNEYVHDEVLHLWGEDHRGDVPDIVE